MALVTVVGHPLREVVNAPKKARHAPLQGVDSLCGLVVAGDDSELFADGAKLERVHYDVVRLIDAVLLRQQDGVPVLVVHSFSGQMVVRQFCLHGVLSIHCLNCYCRWHI